MPEQYRIAGGEDQEEVENDVQNAHQYIKSTGDAHIATASQQGTSDNVEHEERHKQHERAEIDGCISTDLRRCPKPNRQWPADCQTKTCQQQAEQHAHHNGLTHDLPCIAVALGPKQMGYLYRIACGKCAQHALKQPGCGPHEADRG